MKRKQGGPSRRDPTDDRGPQKFGDLLTDLLARRGYAQRSAHDECQRAWAEVVGPLDKFSQAAEVKRGVLMIVVSNSVVLQELTFRKSELIGQLIKALPKHKINDLRFKVGNIS